MSVLLCPQCLGWILSSRDTCPECAARVQLEAPDPDWQTIGTTLGTWRFWLGEVRLDRRRLPERGNLHVTSEGIVFLPDFVSRLPGAVTPIVAPTSGTLSHVWQRIRGPIRPPAMTPGMPQSALSTHIPPTDTSLVDVYQDSPGGLFIPFRVIRGLQAKFRWVHILRTSMRSVSLNWLATACPPAALPRWFDAVAAAREFRELPSA